MEAEKKIGSGTGKIFIRVLQMPICDKKEKKNEN
jgi:hypothetical protein